MFNENIVRLRKLNQMTQEDIAEAVGVSRQAVAKWESGETIPDLEKCKLLAELFGVSLDDLANYEPEDNMDWMFLRRESISLEWLQLAIRDR